MQLKKARDGAIGLDLILMRGLDAARAYCDRGEDIAAYLTSVGRVTLSVGAVSRVPAPQHCPA
jgi:hypothetical protein